ncbi:hypothetical protein O7606_02820 [Micromonospora sp. WMMD882]|nr:hypothetical protein [Micromonospora sp. WMMD882]WBB80329.1 hypothetical protein O7606_02820 [Micromonospora sp. WMMD882]
MTAAAPAGTTRAAAPAGDVRRVTVADSPVAETVIHSQNRRST